MQLVRFGLFFFVCSEHINVTLGNQTAAICCFGFLAFFFFFKKAVKAACSAGGLCLDRSVPQEKTGHGSNVDLALRLGQCFEVNI